MKILDVKLIGSSHDPYIQMAVSNLPAGIKIDHHIIKDNLAKRRPQMKFNTTRTEVDEYEFISGVEDNITNGDKLIIRVYNQNTNSAHYEPGVIRPGHADYVGYETIDNYDYHGGGHFSGRLTVLYVILGSILQPYVPEHVYGKLTQVADFIDTPIRELSIKQLDAIENPLFIYDQNIFNQVNDYLLELTKKQDSIGGLAEFRITNPTLGLGGIDFDSFEGELSKNLFAIGGIKGINFGLGINFITTLGSISNDELYVDNNQVYSKNNFQGGVNGGIVNGYEDIIFNCIIKAPSSVFIPKQTIKKVDGKYINHTLELKGRHDSFIANRIIPVIISMCYITLFDLHLYQKKCTQH